MYDITPLLDVLQESEGDLKYISGKRMAEVFGLNKKTIKRIIEEGRATDYEFDQMCCGLKLHPAEILGIDNWINPVLGLTHMETTPEDIDAEAEAALATVQAELADEWVIVEEDTPSFELDGVFVFADTDEDGRVYIHIDASQYDAEYDDWIPPLHTEIQVDLNGYLIHDGIDHAVVTYPAEVDEV